jgi:thiazole synthase
VIGDERTLFPDNEALIRSTRILARLRRLPYERRSVLPQARGRGRRRGDAAGRANRIGLGIQNVNNIRIIREFSRVPVIVDAGVGTASDAALAMELSADGVLMNTAIAGAQDAVAMARR